MAEALDDLGGPEGVAPALAAGVALELGAVADTDALRSALASALLQGLAVAAATRSALAAPASLWLGRGLPSSSLTPSQA